MSINQYPLQWPAGWPRAKARKEAQFGKLQKVYSEMNGVRVIAYNSKSDLNNEDAVKRALCELGRLGVGVHDSVISTNLTLNLAGFPRGNQGEPGDPGVAVYWKRKNQPMKVMAIDRYTRVRDNIAALAATLEAMRAIERHGGGQVLERAFTGFDALPPPRTCWDILDLDPNKDWDLEAVQRAFRAKARSMHPDTGGSDALMAELNAARDAAVKLIAELGR